MKTQKQGAIRKIAKSGRCPHCRQKLADTSTCPGCSIRYHKECWRALRCGNRVCREYPKPLPVPSVDKPAKDTRLAPAGKADDKPKGYKHHAMTLEAVQASYEYRLAVSRRQLSRSQQPVPFTWFEALIIRFLRWLLVLIR